MTSRSRRGCSTVARGVLAAPRDAGDVLRPPCTDASLSALTLLDTPEARLALSLALGLLLGVERERRKKERAHGAIAGLRTFGLVGLLGGLMSYIALPYAVLAGALIVGALIIVGYALDPDRERDRGMTTEVALLLTYVLGALALAEPSTAAIATIGAAALLYFRTRLHVFVNTALLEAEIHDGLLLLVFAFVVLPLAPDADVGPYGAINPQAIARLMFVVTFISAAGYVTQRVVGARWGLVASGFGSGFVSSTATIAALGLHAKQDPSVERSAAAGATASSIATIVQYGTILAALDRALLSYLALPLGLAVAAALAATALLARQAHAAADPQDAPKGRAFQLMPALVVGAGSALVAVLAAAFGDAIGEAGIVLVSSLSGLVDAHATTGALATLHHGQKLAPATAALALLAALSTNTITKLAMAFLAGPRRYALRVAGGVLFIAAAAWAGLLLRAWA